MTRTHVDIAILVPKADEHVALAQAFGWGLTGSDGKIRSQGAFKVTSYPTRGKARPECQR